MRYVKALVLVLVFFLTMIFLFQNQTSLSQTLAFRLDLLFMPAMTSIELPFYFVLLAAFLLGALACLIVLFMDRVRLTGSIVRANWRAQAMQNEEKKLIAQMEKLAELPRESRLNLLSRFKREKRMEEAQEVEPAQGATREDVDAFFKDSSSPDAMAASQATDTAADTDAKVKTA